jgi:PmbA protein
MSGIFEKKHAEWKELAGHLLKRAEGRGVELEVRFGTNSNLSVKVRKGELEEIRQSGPAGASMRVFKGKRAVSGSSSHMERERLEALVDRLADNVDLVDEDDANGLPEKELLYAGEGDLDLIDPALEAVTVDKAREMALECESAAFAVDKRITNSSGSGVSLTRAFGSMFNSQGLQACAPASGISLSVSPVAEDDKGEKYTDWWFSYARHLEDLEAAAAIGKRAGERCAALIGAQKIPTGKFPVLFDPVTAKDLVELVFGCVSGDSVYKNATFLAGTEGKAIASELVTIIDDPLRKRGLSSALYDNQGVATSLQTVVDKGVLKFYPCDTFSARRLKRQSTGHAGGGGVTSYNLYLQKGATPAADMLKMLDTGLMVTAFIGFSFNQATGDFSRGVRGFWVEKGEIVKPVQEVTVSGNLGTMLKDVLAVGDDLEFRFGTDSPSILLKEMTVSGS